MEPLAELSIIYQDDTLVVVNKPSGLLVHRSPIDKREHRFALQEVRNLVGTRVYPVHRLDKPTSGVLIFTKDAESANVVQRNWHDDTCRKHYYAIVRGYTPDNLYIDHALKLTHDDQKLRDTEEAVIQDAQTTLTTLATASVPIPHGWYEETRLSLVDLHAHTGRRHQLRRHMKHISHPIIGDPKYGKGPLNRLLSNELGLNHLMLHCRQIVIDHPTTHESIEFNAIGDEVWQQALKLFDYTPQAK